MVGAGRVDARAERAEKMQSHSWLFLLQANVVKDVCTVSVPLRSPVPLRILTLAPMCC